MPAAGQVWLQTGGLLPGLLALPLPVPWIPWHFCWNTATGPPQALGPPRAPRVRCGSVPAGAAVRAQEECLSFTPGEQPGASPQPSGLMVSS